MSTKMIFYLALLFTVVARSDATSCECNKINSWEELRSLILVHNKIESSVQHKILLCPFSIKKTITKETNHWDEFIPIKAPMHLSCHKESASDVCSIVIEGEKCEFEENCGRQMIKIKSSDVTIEGLKITKAKDNIISTEKNLQNINLIDLAFYQNSVPGSRGYSNALISVGGGTSIQILYSEFGWNKATVVENRGHLMIHSTEIADTRIRTPHMKGGALKNFNSGSIVMTSSSLKNTKFGPGIFSSGKVVDGGRNCIFGNGGHIYGSCNGIEEEGTGCVPLMLSGQCSS